MLITAVGLYGVISYLAGRRTAEIGIRMALGANRGDILWLVLREVLAMMAAGCAIGLLGALLAARAIESQMSLFGVQGADPLVLAVAAVVLGATAVAAGYFPARRAAKIQPVTALRHS